MSALLRTEYEIYVYIKQSNSFTYVKLSLQRCRLAHFPYRFPDQQCASDGEPEDQLERSVCQGQDEKYSYYFYFDQYFSIYIRINDSSLLSLNKLQRFRDIEKGEYEPEIPRKPVLDQIKTYLNNTMNKNISFKPDL